MNRTHDVPSQLASLDLLNSEEIDGSTKPRRNNFIKPRENQVLRKLDTLVGTKVSVKNVSVDSQAKT